MIKLSYIFSLQLIIITNTRKISKKNNCDQRQIINIFSNNYMNEDILIFPMI